MKDGCSVKRSDQSGSREKKRSVVGNSEESSRAGKAIRRSDKVGAARYPPPTFFPPFPLCSHRRIHILGPLHPALSLPTIQKARPIREDECLTWNSSQNFKVMRTVSGVQPGTPPSLFSPLARATRPSGSGNSPTHGTPACGNAPTYSRADTSARSVV